MTEEEIDKCFKMFDKEGKGHFTFADFTRVSKLVQGYEIDQLFSNGDKFPVKAKGKRVKGFAENQNAEYDAQKTFKEKNQKFIARSKKQRPTDKQF